GATREDGLDLLGLRVDTDPVADGRQLVELHEPGRRGCAQLAGFGKQVVGTAVLDCDAGRREAVRAMLGERGFPAVVPPESVKQRFRGWKCQPKLLCVRGMNGRAARRCTR